MTHRFLGIHHAIDDDRARRRVGSRRPLRLPDEGAQQAPVLRRMARLRMDRAVGLVVLLLAVAAAGMLWMSLSLTDPLDGPAATRTPLRDLADSLRHAGPQCPGDPDGGGCSAAFRGGRRNHGAYDRESLPSLRKPRRHTFGSEDRHAADPGVFHGPVTVTVLIPAHNEQDKIGATLRSLQEHDDPPDRIIVVADNCTDSTEQVARAAGVEVVPTVGNTRRRLVP